MRTFKFGVKIKNVIQKNATNSFFKSIGKIIWGNHLLKVFDNFRDINSGSLKKTPCMLTSESTLITGNSWMQITHFLPVPSLIVELLETGPDGNRA